MKILGLLMKASSLLKGFLLLSLLLPPALFPAEYFIFSYRVVVRDNYVLNESYRFSKTMAIPLRYEVVGECEVGAAQEEEEKVIQRLKASPERVLECFFKRGVALMDDTSVSSLASKSLTVLWIPPTHVVVEFKEGFVMMRIIQPKP